MSLSLPCPTKSRKGIFLAAFFCILLTLPGPISAQEPVPPQPAPPEVPAADLAPAAAEAARAAAVLQQRADDQASVADGMFRRTWYEPAAREYLKLIQEFPDYEGLPQAYFNWAESFRLLDDFDQAIKIYNQLRMRYGDHELSQQATVNVANLYIDGQEFDEAVKVLQTVDPDKMDEPLREAFFYHLGIAYNNTKKTDEAIRQFSKIASNPLGHETHFRLYARLSLAYIYRNLGELDKAAKLFTELHEYPGTEGAARQEVLFQLATIAGLQKKFAGAVQYYNELIKKFPTGDFADQSRINLGWTLMQFEERYQEIIDLFQGEAQLGPDALYLQGVSCKRLKRYEAGLKFYDSLSGFGKSEFHEYAEFDAVECLYQLGRWDACVKRARAFVAAYPHHKQTANAYYFMGQCLATEEAYDDAAVAFETALGRFWGEWDYREDAVVILADIYIRAGQLAKAAATYRRILTIPHSDRHIEALYTAAECEMRAENYEQAYEDLHLIYKKYPSAPEAPKILLDMAELKLQLDENAAAVDLFNKFLIRFDADPLAPRVRYLRGTQQYRAGETQAAIADLRLCVKAPAFEDSDLARLFLGYALWETNVEDEALNIFAELLQTEEMASDFVPELLAQIGERYMELNDFDAAENAYNMLVRSESAHRLIGLQGLGHLAFRREQWSRAHELFERVGETAGDGATAGYAEIAAAYQGEVLRQLKREDEAFIILKRTLEGDIDELRASAVANLAIARIYNTRMQYDDAMRHACLVWIRYNDPIYTPAAMLFTIQLLLERDKLDEGQQTYKELRNRYPLELKTYEQDEKNAAFFKKLEAIEPTP
jgi:TolA-binding protein